MDGFEDQVAELSKAEVAALLICAFFVLLMGALCVSALFGIISYFRFKYLAVPTPAPGRVLELRTVERRTAYVVVRYVTQDGEELVRTIPAYIPGLKVGDDVPLKYVPSVPKWALMEGGPTPLGMLIVALITGGGCIYFILGVMQAP